MSREEINIVLASNNKGGPALAVAVRSTLDHCTRKCNIYVLNTDFTNKNKKKLTKSWDTSSTGRILFIDVDSKILKPFKSTLYQRNKEVYLVYFIGDLLPQEVTKCIYMQTDLLVTDDICKVYDIDLQNNTIAAVVDYPALHGQMYDKKHQKLSIGQPKIHLQSGLLAVDLNAWRKNEIGEKLKVYAEKNRDHLLFMEQDALSAVLNQSWLKIDEKWDMLAFRTTDPKHKGVVHMQGQIKPWHPDYNGKFKEPFLEVLNKTEFKNAHSAQPFLLKTIFLKLSRRIPNLEIIVEKTGKETRKLLKHFYKAKTR